MQAKIDDLICTPATYADSALYHRIFNSLRRDDPVHWVEPQDYRPFWLITKLEDIREVERQNDIFLNAGRPTLRSRTEEEKIRAVTGGKPDVFETILHMDGMDHRAHRAVAQSWFMPANLKKLEGAIAQVAREFVDRLERQGGTADFCEVVAARYPLRIIMTIFGVPPEDEDQMLYYSKMITAPTDDDVETTEPRNELRIRAAQGLFDYFRKLLADRRANPRDDLSSVIANAEVDGKPISELAALSYCVTIATAGHDTTSMTSSGGLLALVQHPEQMARLRADRSLMPGAIDEILRFVSPVKHMMREAKVDAIVRGKQIRAGDSLMLCFPSGNRDEDVFDNPHEFRIDRSPNRQIAFGSGVHSCLGLHLAKMEIRALYAELLDRVDRFELDGTPGFYKGFVVQGLKHLPIRYSMSKVTA